MKRNRYQVPGVDEPLSLEEMKKEITGFIQLIPYAMWQTGVICHSGYPLGGFKTVGDNFEGKLRVLVFSIN